MKQTQTGSWCFQRQENSVDERCVQNGKSAVSGGALVQLPGAELCFVHVGGSVPSMEKRGGMALDWLEQPLSPIGY